MDLISASSDLNSFRNHWTGARILDLLAESGGRLRIDWEVGVGKSYNMDQVIECAVLNNHYQLVIALLPTRQLINERAWTHRPPNNVPVVNLKPRPSKLCGPLRNTQWQCFEKNNLGALGRNELCGRCPERGGCDWHDQYGKRLQGSRVIFGTQAHLERSPYFIAQLRRWTGAGQILIILDEVNFMMKPFKRQILYSDLYDFVQTLTQIQNQHPSKSTRQWLDYCQLLIPASTIDLRETTWRAPFLSPKWSIIVQQAGWQRYGARFIFLGYELQLFSYSLPASRERLANREIHFTVRPQINGDFIIYSGTAHQKLSEYRLGKAFVHPFSNTRFYHPGTRWYNIASRLGMRRHFQKNAPQILDFFAQLLMQRLREGKKVLLVAKKCFIPLCATEIQQRLHAFGFSKATLITDHFKTADLNSSQAIPLINFGVIGTNLFEHFDCCFCLTGYYVNEEVINGILQDLTATDFNIPFKISIKGHPQRRCAEVANQQHHYTDIQSLAQPSLDYQEMGTVLQAVGRVRPYTKAREIITFQCANHPTLEYTKEFRSIAEIRRFFEIPTWREYQKQQTIAAVQTAKASGYSQKKTTAELDVGLRTVQRYWNPTRGRHESF